MRHKLSIALVTILALVALMGCTQVAANQGAPAVQPTATVAAPTATPQPPTATPVPPTATPLAAPAAPVAPAPAEPAAAAWEPVVGVQVSDFELLGVDGAKHALSEYVGQAMILNFWATWCPHCQAEVPVFQQVYEERAAEGFIIVAVSVGESPDTVTQFVQENGLTFPVLLDSTGVAGSTYQVSGIPASYFVDATGMIRGTHVGAITDVAALNQVVDTLLK